LKQKLIHIAIKYLPDFILEKMKSAKKKVRNRELQQQAESNKGYSQEYLESELKKIGIQAGDHVLVHSALSKIGYINGGAQTLVNALLKVITEQGTLLMPSFPASGRNKDYLEQLDAFDIKNTPSQMGKATEIFRLMSGVKRSFHPTDPVCAYGSEADYFTNSHFGEITPYTENSPFRKLCNKNGKILMLGTTLNGAGTNLHTLEDAVDFKYPVYDDKVFEVKMIDATGAVSSMKTKVHNPVYSAKRNCDALKPIFEKEGVLKNGMIGEANSMLIIANGMFNVMLNYYKNYGVTMYTPYGEHQQLKTKA
jgi:aminoglycoside 3-N-acetyltransferase